MFHTKLCFNIYVKEHGFDTTVGKLGSLTEAWRWNFKIFMRLIILIICILEQSNIKAIYIYSRIVTYMQNIIYNMKSKSCLLGKSPSDQIPWGSKPQMYLIPNWTNAQLVQIPKWSKHQMYLIPNCGFASQAAHMSGLYGWFTRSTGLTSSSWGC